MTVAHVPSPVQLRQASTEDFDDQATLLQGWNQHYDQLSSGGFRGAIAELRFDDVHLFIESTSRALFQRGKLADDAVAIGVPLRAPGQGLFCGTALNDRSAPLFSGKDGFEFYSPDRLVMGGMVVSREALAEWLPEETVGELDRGAHLTAVSPATLTEARRFLQTIMDICRVSPRLAESEALRRQVRLSVLACMADLLTDARAQRSAGEERRFAIVRKAREILDTANDEPLTVEELCRQLHVSRRTLQNCFQEVLGINPMAFLRTQRLNQVRHLLKEVDSVTEAATAVGFWHFGHFSQEYKKLFGELPSDTLRRHQRGRN